MLDKVTQAFSLTDEQAQAAQEYITSNKVTLRQNNDSGAVGYCEFNGGAKYYVARINPEAGTHYCTCRSSEANAKPNPCKHAIALAIAVDSGYVVDDTQPVKSHKRTSATVTRQPVQPGQRRASGDKFREKVSKLIGTAIQNLAASIVPYIERGEVPFLVGPTGCGKTSCMRFVCDKLGYGLEAHTGSESWADADLVGLKMATGDIMGVIARAFERANKGEKVIIFLDEFLRNNKRVQDLLMRGIQRQTAEECLLQGIDTGGEAAYIIEAPVFGRVWALAKNIAWALGANPWGAKPDDAFVRRIEPVFVGYDVEVLKPFAQEFADKVKMIWQANVDGSINLPIEYQQLANAANENDSGVFVRYLNRLRLLDQGQMETATMLLGMMT